MAKIRPIVETLVRKSPCALTEERVWKARLHLYNTHLLIKGWSLKGRFERKVDWTMLNQVDWFMVHAPEPNLVLLLHDGSPLPMRVKAPGLWKFEIDDQRLREKPFDDAPLPGMTRKAPRQTGTV